MGLFDKIKSLFSNKISDQEVNSKELGLFPNCEVNIEKQNFAYNNGFCPSYKYNIGQNV